MSNVKVATFWLERCPECDYELRGLPGVGRCPEAGPPTTSGCFLFQSTAVGSRGRLGVFSWCSSWC